MRHVLPLLLLSALVVLAGGCRNRSAAARPTLSMKGSDTLVQVATGWAQRYSATRGRAAVSASGGGSGVGIAGLIDGTVDLATASREIKPAEREAVRAHRGQDVRELFVASDALAIYVHPTNPLTQLTLAQLGELWAEGGALSQWNQLVPGMTGRVVLIGRQNSSGTYDYFRETVCGLGADGKSREFRGGVSELTGSSEVVEKVASAPLALGYSGMGYRTQQVKWLAIARSAGAPAVAPSAESARTGAYPIARRLYVYTVGEPTDDVRDFLEWVLSDEGQEIVAREGYVPVR